MRVLGVTLGDERGIGPEVAFKALSRSRLTERGAVVIIGGGSVIDEQARIHGWNSRIPVWSGRPQPERGLWKIDTTPEGVSPARASILALNRGANLAMKGEIDGLVTGPVNKASILREGIQFTGQTEWLTGLAGDPNTGMMLLGTDRQERWLRVLLATTHIPLKEVPRTLSPQGIMRSIVLASRACQELGLKTQRIAVCGLNPHAGEEGQLGDEEQAIIGPAIQEAQKMGIAVSGPWPADTVFRDAIQERHDVVVAMYHDQGLAPLKLVAFETGVNWTVGLPYPRTSPDHGTAFDIAGKGMADPSSMEKALELAWILAGRKSPKG